MRIIFVPQYPTAMRYQEWWFTELPKQFKQAGLDVHVLGKNAVTYMKAANGGMFSPVESSIDLETAQIKEYTGMKLRDDDILFLADLSFPGLFGNVLYHKRPERCFAYCHATSLNKLDYFAKDRHSKYSAESATASLMDVIFIGSNYHDEKIRWHNTLVTRLPYPPLKCKPEKKQIKEHDIVSVSRPTPQKVDSEIEALVEDEFSTKIVRRTFDTWISYYTFLSRSKVLLITAKEETFGYQVIDAILSGCIPIAPNKFSYVELLPRNYLYDNREELLETLKAVFDRDVNVPVILCTQEIESFYKNIIQVMKG